MAFKQDIEKQFRKIAETMMASVEVGQSATAHSSTKGRNTEFILINFLRKFLPAKYSLSQGQIVSPQGELSPQLDIIIHDETTFPVATVLEGGEKVVFAHSVYAVIAVKSLLSVINSRSQAIDLIENLRKTRDLENKVNESMSSVLVNRNKVKFSYFGFVFRNDENNVAQKLNDSDSNAPDFLTALAILDASRGNERGLYVNPHFCTEDTPNNVSKEIVHKPKEGNTLLAFYRTLFNRLCENDVAEVGDLTETRKIIKEYKPWGEWGF